MATLHGSSELYIKSPAVMAERETRLGVCTSNGADSVELDGEGLAD